MRAETTISGEPLSSSPFLLRKFPKLLPPILVQLSRRGFVRPPRAQEWCQERPDPAHKRPLPSLPSPSYLQDRDLSERARKQPRARARSCRVREHSLAQPAAEASGAAFELGRDRHARSRRGGRGGRGQGTHGARHCAGDLERAEAVAVIVRALALVDLGPRRVVGGRAAVALAA